MLTVLPGVRGEEDLQAVLAYLDAGPEERDYSAISAFAPPNAEGVCVYCNHCQPCPAHLDIAAVTKFLDLAKQQKTVLDTVREHYWSLPATAEDCLMCGRCEPNCPFGVNIRENMRQAREIFRR